MTRAMIPDAMTKMRQKLFATAAIAVVLMVAMILLTLETLSVTRSMQEQMLQSHERLRTLWQLQGYGKRYQKLTYQASTSPEGKYDALLAEARADFDAALERVTALPHHNAHHRDVAQRLQKQAAEVRALLEQAPQLAREVEQLWLRSGYRAALAELTELATPYDAFFGTLAAEVPRDGEQFADAMRQAAASQGMIRAIVPAMLTFGLLVSATLFVVLLKRMALQKTNLALEAEDERRRAFLVDASHELRIPLTIIRGEAQVALRRDAGEHPETAEALERILSQTRAVTRMLDDLFLIARAEAGGLHMNLQRVDVGELASATASDFSTIACESGARVSCRRDTGLVVMADVDRLRQMLAALIDNALRHTWQGVTVKVEARRDGASVLLTVDDDGPGIDPAIADQLFQRFRRSRTRSDGSGLGLTVTRALAEAHTGSVGIERSPMGGARIVVRLQSAPTLTHTRETSTETGAIHEFTATG